MAATPPRPSLSGQEGSKARDRPKRNQPEPPGSDDEVGCKRPRLVLPDPTADEGATRRHHLPFLDPAADEGATRRHHLPFLDPAADEGALVPGAHTFPSGPGGEEKGSRAQAQNREEVGKNGEKEVSRGHAQGREEGALSPNLSFLHLNADEGADAVVHNNSSGRGGCYGKGDKLEKGEEGLRGQAQEEISKNEEILEKFENSEEGSRRHAQEVSKNEAILDFEKKQIKEDLPVPLESVESALLDEFEAMYEAYESIALLKGQLTFGLVNLSPALRDRIENAWRSIKDRLPTCRALIRRIREANGPSYSVPDIFLE